MITRRQSSCLFTLDVGVNGRIFLLLQESDVFVFLIKEVIILFFYLFISRVICYKILFLYCILVHLLCLFIKMRVVFFLTGRDVH